MEDEPLVSIIVPLGRSQGYLKACMEACFALKGRRIEIIVLPDEPLGWSDDRIRVHATGPASPAKKRNIGAGLGKGSILAFIDDDTRPLAGWLDAALPHFDDPGVAAVGGPAVTPPDDPFWAQASGAAYESWALSGTETWRYRPAPARDVDDVPSCNLLVRRTAFEEVGGFFGDYWPGEDTFLCLALIQKGYQISYEPRAVIEHHRRNSLKGHLKQIGNYALHRGYFAKKYPQTSFRLIYFLPTLLVLMSVVALILAAVEPAYFARPILVGVGVYLALVLASMIGRPLPLMVPGAVYVILSHLTYGICFPAGLFSRSMKEEGRSSNKICERC